VEATIQRKRFAVRHGVDPRLDENRRLQAGLHDLMKQVADEDVEDLPAHMSECSMVYVPKLGYMLKVVPWDDSLSEDEYAVPDPELHYMFCADGAPYYKSERCVELDESVGDVATVAAERETAVMVELTRRLMRLSESILEMYHFVGVLDCLLSMALAAAENGWTLPRFGSAAKGEISVTHGRHPLLEVAGGGAASVVPNSASLGGEKKMMLLTGPNACGKSVFLKQVSKAHIQCTRIGRIF